MRVTHTRLKKKTIVFSLNRIFVGLDRVPEIAAGGRGQDITPPRSALADYDGPIKKGTTTIQTHVYTANIFPSCPILTC